MIVSIYTPINEWAAARKNYWLRAYHHFILSFIVLGFTTNYVMILQNNLNFRKKNCFWYFTTHILHNLWSVLNVRPNFAFQIHTEQSHSSTWTILFLATCTNDIDSIYCDYTVGSRSVLLQST